MDAVRHFLGFADDSDARVVKNCVLTQISFGRRVAAEWRLQTACSALPSTQSRVWNGLLLAQLVIGALPLRMSARKMRLLPR